MLPLYRDVVNRLDRGFCVLELVRDRGGRPVDAIYRIANAAYEEMTGLKDVLGRHVRELAPGLDPFWLQVLGRIAASGETERFSEYARNLGRWFEIEAYRLGSGGSALVALLLTDVSERRRTEMALRRSEARFRLMADAVPQIVWIVEPDGRVAFLNAQWTELTGEPFDEMNVDALIARHVHPDDRDATATAFAQAAVARQAFAVEHRIRDREGGYRWFLLRALPYQQETGGTGVTLFGASTDIHDRKTAEKALVDSEERLRLIVEHAADYAIFLIDEGGAVTEWWPGAEAVFGWSRREIVGRRLDILYTPDDRAEEVPRRELETALRAGSAPDIRWHLRKDGRRVFIEGSVVRLADGSGAGRGLLKIGRDVTQSRIAETLLRESEARFRQFGDASSDLLWVRDATTRHFEYLSPACATILGLDCEGLRAEDGHARWEALVHAPDRGPLAAHLESVASGEQSVCEFRIVRPADAEPRWLQDTGFPLVDEDGRVRRVAGITSDITEGRETRERLKLLVAELHHRTRNLLAVVQALAERTLVSSDGLEDFRTRFYPRLSALARVNELLSRLDVHERVTFDQLVRAELSAHGAFDPGQDQRVATTGPTGVRLRSSTIQTLALALHELCTNSLKYGALSDPAGRLSLAWREEVGPDGDRRLVFEWEESGGGAAAPVGNARGFGRELIERALPRQLKTEVEYTIGPDGVRCVISLPLSSLTEGSALGGG